MVELVKPNYDLITSYLDFIEEMRRNDEKIWEGMIPKPDETPNQFVDRLVLAEIAPGLNLVPESTYWGLKSGIVVGRIALRHRLTEKLSEFGGNIGYEVRPSNRRQGVAKEMLKLLLRTPKAKEIGRVLLTCAPNNLGSNKTILANGGVLAKTAYVETWKRDTNYYWIDVGTSEPDIEIHHLGPEQFQRAQTFYSSVGYEQAIQGDDIVMSATVSDEIVGIVRLAREDGIIVLRGMQIALQFQRRGIGSMMLRKLEQYIGENDCYCLPHDWLENFYGQIGFRRIGEQETPTHLQERLRNYHLRYPNLIAMKRAKGFGNE